MGHTGDGGVRQGAEFRNRLMKRINHVFKVDCIATTPYNPRSNGLVQKHVAWEGTTQRAHDNATRGNWTGRVWGSQFMEYAVGDQFYRMRNRVRVFKSVQDQEMHKINWKLQARYEGPYKIVEKVSAVVYVADIDGVRRRVHAINMKPVARMNTREPARRLPHE